MTNCRCGSKATTKVRTVDNFIVDSCTKCAVDILKQTGHFSIYDSELHTRKNMDFLNELEIVSL